jgi:DNA polymerase III delta prime subunit
MKILNKLNNEIQKLQTKLSKMEVYEDFGQKEVRKLREKYVDISDYSKESIQIQNTIDNFSNWCSNHS